MAMTIGVFPVPPTVMFPTEITATSARRLRRGLARQQIGPDRVGHEREIPRLQPVAVDLGWRALHQPLDELRHDSRVGRGRVLPRAEHIEVAQRHGLEAVELLEQPAIILIDPVGAIVLTVALRTLNFFLL